MKHSLVFGLVGLRCTSAMRKRWNEEFRRRGVDAFFDFYRATTVADLELRLSEMCLHERRGYIIDAKFQEAILPLLDELDPTANSAGKVDTVLNRGGVFKGFLLHDQNEKESIQKRLAIWEL